MIRGYIERVTAELVSGWIFSEAFSVRDRRITATLGEEVLGAGRVEHFRQDLVDAGLGDGFLGFHFRVRPLTAQEIPWVTVRLEGSDMVLQQPAERRAAVAAAPAATGSVPAAATDLPRLPDPCLRWMQARGWLSALECDVIRLLDRFGVYAHDLRETPGQAAPATPEAAAAALLETYAMREVSVARRELGSLDDLAAALRDTAGEAASPAGPARALPVYALWCAVPGLLGVAEASHAEGAADGAAQDALTDYAYGADTLLLLHRHCRFVPRPRAQAGRLLLVTGHLPPPRRGRPASQQA